MDVLIITSQTLLYLVFSILIGSFILLLVPNKYRPEIKFPKRLVLISACMLPIFAFVPVLDTILYLSSRIGFFESLKIVLTTFTGGTAWVATLLVSSLLIGLISLTSPKKISFSILGIWLTVGLILTVAWSSHASSINQSIGMISDFLHLIAVSIWVGILLIIGWFSSNNSNWLKFLNWFSVVAFSCFLVTVISGLLLMNILVDGYVDSWMISYGQGLLVKHIFILPLLFYAIINGFIVKNKLMKDTAFQPVPWIRLESFILFTIFAITAFYSQQAPPHGNYLTNDNISPLFRVFHDGTIDAGNTIDFAINSNTLWFLFLAMLFLCLMIFSYIKKASTIVSFLFSCFFVTSIYVLIMVTVVVR